MAGSPARPPVRGADRAWSESFVVAALVAPLIALVVFLVGIVGAAVLSEGAPGSIWQAAGGLLLVTVIVFIAGAIPSLVFGGAVLALIGAAGMKRSPLVCAIGGGAAAALYVVAGIWMAFGSPGAALLFAPWAMLLTLKEPGSFPASMKAGDFWPAVSIVISGVVAGLIYARSTQRG